MNLSFFRSMGRREKETYTSIIPLILALIISFNLFTCNALEAQVSVNSVIMHFPKGQRPVQNAIIFNSSDKTAYVVVEVEAIPDPAADSAKTIATTDLLASPKAFSIEPHGQRTVRLLLKSPPAEMERVFRVGFIPQDRGFGEESSKTINGRTTVIRVLTGMGMLVFADPLKPEAKLEWNRSDSQITFINRGNIQIFLDDIKACGAKDNNCKTFSSKRIYAGASYSIPATRSNVVTLLKKEGASGDSQRLTIDP